MKNISVLMDAVAHCLEACNHCFQSCLKEDEIDYLRECILTDKECADICSTVLSYKGREESLPKDLISLCREICLTCGKECEQHEHMEHCQDCAQACFECAEACKAAVS